MTDAATTDKTLTDADTKLDGASTPEVAKDALSGLEQLKIEDRNATVAAASEHLTQQGELPELMLITQSSDNLLSLFDRDGNTTKESLKDAAETGYLPHGIQLSVTDQIVANALYTNFDAIQSSVGQNPYDDKISISDLSDQRDANGSMPREMGESRQGLNSLVTMLGDDQGSFDQKKYTEVFGTDAPTRAQLEHFKDDPNGYGALSPSDKQAVDFMIDRFSDLNWDGKGDTLTGDELWGFAHSRGINYRDQQEEMNAQTDAYNEAHTVTADMTPEEVDALIAQLAEPSGGATVFDVLDNSDGKRDGLVSDKALADSNFLGTEAEAAKSLANHIEQFDDNGDGRIWLTELAKGSSNYKDIDSNDKILQKAQDVKAQEIRDEDTDTPGDITDDTKATMALFGNEDGELDKDRWKEILAPNRTEEEGLDVSKAQIMDAIRSDKFSELTSSEQRGLTALYDNFDQYSNAMGAEKTLGADEFLKAASEKGVKWNDEEQRTKIINDQALYNANNSTSPDSEVLKNLVAKANEADAGYLQSKFNDQKDMSSEELNKLIKQLPEGDPNRNLMEYMSKFHNELAGEEGYLSTEDMTAFIEAGHSTIRDDSAETVALTYWRGGENIDDFAAALSPDDPQAGLDQLLKINNMTYEQLNDHFWYDKNGGIVIPVELYEKYYGVPYEEDAA